MSKPKFAMYWAAACGGCEIAVLNIHEKILDVDANFEVVFWPVAMDAKYKDVEAMEDGSILLTLFNGGIRNDEHEHIAHLLRRKSKILVAFGSCACEGCIPGLANFSSIKDMVDTAFTTITTDNPDNLRPQPHYKVPEGEITIPTLYPVLHTLEQVVDVDYYMPGCPPESHQIAAVIDLVIQVLQGKAELPPKGATIGAGNSTVCDECPRKRNVKTIKEFGRIQLTHSDPELCLLEQGIPCNGPATRSGCDARCPSAGAQCIGCYGPAEGVVDYGARLISAFASVIDSNKPDEIDKILDGLVDPAGQFYRFNLAGSLLRSSKFAAERTMNMQRITIDPITRLEGHGKIEIFLNEQGNVTNTYFQIPELRGFERFCVGRPVEEMPLLTNRICGVCPEAHHMAAAKAADAVYHVEVPRTGKMLRELLYSAFYATDHTTHFYALGGPDFIMGPDAPVAERNILGVIHKVGLEIGGKVIQMRKYGHTVVEIIGGRKVHPCTSIPGGLTKGITEEQRKEIEQMGRWAIEFAQFSLKAFNDIVLGNKAYVDLILGDIYTHKTYYMGMVDENNKINFYDGKVRVVAPDGKEYVKYEPKDYVANIAEHVEPWTYLKFPYLKKVGWKGFVDGPDSGVYMATPLSRLNAADGMATPLAQAEYEKFYSTLGGKPVHQRLAIHWARLIELLYAAERWVELATDPEITSPDFHAIPTAIPTEGVGIVEAPRGTLTHHYWTDERGVVTKVNLIVGTTNNYAPITMSIKKAADSLIKNGNVNEGLLNMVEMAFRAYDPCFGCATHSLPGQMPLEITIHDADGNPVNVMRQFCE